VCTCSPGSSRNLIAGFPDIAAAVTQLDEGVVLDGELVIWNAGRFDFAALQDRLRSGSRRVRNLVTAAPAASIVFDLLATTAVTSATVPIGSGVGNWSSSSPAACPTGSCSSRLPPTPLSRAAGCSGTPRSELR